jgi:CTP:molybdopterin cytidylyltransferase MocA
VSHLLREEPKVQVAVTAAGDSREAFISAGFGAPKSLVEVDGRPVICRAIESYALCRELTCVALNSQEDEEWGISDCVVREFPQISTVRVPTGARGALVSALFAIEDFDPDLPLVIAAGDSEVIGGIGGHVAELINQGADAGTIAFQSSQPRYSYLAVNSAQDIIQVSEKHIIGPWATTGVFYFRSTKLFYEAAKWCLTNNAQLRGVFYVSSALNYVVSVAGRVRFMPIDSAAYRPWSLPADFRALS